MFIAVIGLTMGSVSAKTATKKSKKETFTVKLNVKMGQVSSKKHGKYKVMVKKGYYKDSGKKYCALNFALFKNKKEINYKKYYMKTWVHLKSKNKWVYYLKDNYGVISGYKYSTEKYGKLALDADKVKIKTRI